LIKTIQIRKWILENLGEAERSAVEVSKTAVENLTDFNTK
jgi:hypothetical protein